MHNLLRIFLNNLQVSDGGLGGRNIYYDLTLSVNVELRLAVLVISSYISCHSGMLRPEFVYVLYRFRAMFIAHLYFSPFN